jgi:quercetin 2,3-dioxygenase
MDTSDHSVQHPRTVERLVQGQATSDGAGVKLTRVLTQDLQRRLDPFLMLDAFGTDNPGDYIGGFPDHPHRGFETVTYICCRAACATATAPAAKACSRPAACSG